MLALQGGVEITVELIRLKLILGSLLWAGKITVSVSREDRYAASAGRRPHPSPTASLSSQMIIIHIRGEICVAAEPGVPIWPPAGPGGDSPFDPI